MSKFHINKHGVPAPCRAQAGNCPLGGEDSHFDSEQDAQAEADRRNEKESGLLQNMPQSYDFTNAGEEYTEFKRFKVETLLEDYLEKIDMKYELDSIIYDEDEYGHITDIIDNDNENRDYFEFEQEVVGVIDFWEFEEDEEGFIPERERMSAVIDAIESLNDSKGSKEEIMEEFREKMTNSYISDHFSSKREVSHISPVEDVQGPEESAVARKVFEYGANRDKLYRLYDEGPEYAKERLMHDFMEDEGHKLSDVEKHYLEETDKVDVALDQVGEFYYSPVYGEEGQKERVSKIGESFENWLNEPPKVVK